MTQKSKLLFLMPTDIYQSWPFANDFTKFVTKIPAVTFPQLAATLKDISYTHFDGQRENISFKNYLKLLSQYNIFAIKCEAEVTALNTEINIKLIKKINPKATLILGGPHPSVFDIDWCSKGADIVVRKEGEITFPLILNALQNKDSLKNIQGITFKDNGKIIQNEDREFIDNLDNTPVPKFEILNFNLYNLYFSAQGYTASIETSRGCAYGCSFCSTSFLWDKQQRYKSAERVITEIKKLYKLGVRQLAIIDESFAINIKRDTEILQSILKNNLKLSWGCFIRCDTVINNPHFIKLAVKSGLKLVYTGFESSNEESLQNYNKNFKNLNPQKFMDVYNLLHKNKVFVVGLFVDGYLAGSNDNYNLPAKNFCDIAAYSNLRPMPNTPIYNNLKKSGYKLKNMFYHDRYLPAFIDYKGTPQKNQTFLESIKNDISFKHFYKMIRGNFIEKNFYRNLYSALFKNIFSFSLAKINNLLNLTFSKKSLNKRQNILVKKYTEEKYISDLIKPKYFMRKKL